MKSSLSTARSRVPAEEDEESSSAPLSRGAGAPGMPDLASLMGAMGGGGRGGAGGMPDMAGLLSNPAVMQMAQQMMANGGLEQMMQNPYAAFPLVRRPKANAEPDFCSLDRMLQQMMGGAGGGAGGMPDMAALLNDPNMRRMAEQFGAGLGGGAGAGGRRPPGQNDGEDGPDNMYS